MRYTVLELTQAVLSSMDSDEINSINDTVESQQVVEILKTVTDDIISRAGITTNLTLFNLTASDDPTKPTLMIKPDGIENIRWVRYNVQKIDDPDPVWANLQFLMPEDFVQMMYENNPSTDTGVGTFTHTIGASNIIFYYRNDMGPRYYTSFDDNTMFFDAYDSVVDTTLQSSKTLCYGATETSFLKEDDFVPNLQPQQFALLLAEAKSLAWAELKQTPHTKAEQTARRNWVHAQKTRRQVPDGRKIGSGANSFDTLPNFGRNR
jgi:hypothetical protein